MCDDETSLKVDCSFEWTQIQALYHVVGLATEMEPKKTEHLKAWWVDDRRVCVGWLVGLHSTTPHLLHRLSVDAAVDFACTGRFAESVCRAFSPQTFLFPLVQRLLHI